MSFAPEVIADSDGKWYGNGLRFATEEEAQGNVKALEWRWMAVKATRVVPSDDPVNYKWEDNRLVPVTSDEEFGALVEKLNAIPETEAASL